MPHFLKLPSGRIIAPAHIMTVLEGSVYTYVTMTSGIVTLSGADSDALLAWLDTCAVEVGNDKS